MATFNMADPAVRAQAIANGSIWSTFPKAIEAAIEDINSGRVPMPDNIPAQYQPYIKDGLTGPEQPPVAPAAGGSDFAQ